MTPKSSGHVSGKKYVPMSIPHAPPPRAKFYVQPNFEKNAPSDTKFLTRTRSRLK